MWLLFLLFSSLVYGAELSEDVKVKILNDWSGGLNTSAAPYKIPDNMSPNMRNVLIDERNGSIVKRNGFVLCGNSTSTLSKINFQYPFYNESGSKEFLISDSSVILTTKDCNSYTLIRNNLNTASNLSATQLRNKVWLTNGQDSVFTWDGSSMALLNGNSGTPNVPKGKFIATYQDRIFIYNRDTNNSELDWSELTDTNAVIIAPDNALAWPAINALNIGQGDGTVGTALWTYRGQLQIGKEKSIFTLFGTDSASYFARKTESQIGPIGHTAVQVLDGYSYFLAKDGIYKFDGSFSERISDTIRGDVLNITKNTSNIKKDIWETKSDFNSKGQFFNSTMPIANDGFLSLQTTAYLNDLSAYNGDPNSVNKVYTFGVNGSSSTSYTAVGNLNVPNNYIGLLSTIAFRLDIKGPGCISGNMTIKIRNSDTNEISTITQTIGSSSRNEVIFRSFLEAPAAGIAITRALLDSSSIQYKIEVDTSLCGGPTIQEIKVSSIDYYNRNDVAFTVGGHALLTISTNAGQYLSQVTTISTLNFWDSFNSVNQTNGGTINFYFHACSSANCVSTTAWTSITPGSVISASTNSSYYQWATTMTSIDRFNPPTIDNVTVSHNEGTSSSLTPKTAVWKNRFWMVVSTDTSGTLFTIYVKSLITNPNPNAWMIFSGIPLTSIGIFNDLLYGGDYTSGRIYRLDNGTNDNGSAIDAFYETPDLILDSNFTYKTLVEYLIDAEKETGATLNVGTSVGGGVYTTDSYDLSGSGRFFKSGYMQNKFGKYVRFKFRNNNLDKGMTINNFGLFYKVTPIREP